jgi:proprotein convertase subtilisin/kexin type 2
MFNPKFRSMPGLDRPQTDGPRGTVPTGSNRTWNPLRVCLILASSLLLAACGGGGSGSSQNASGPDGLPNQGGCFYQYTLISSPLLSGEDRLFSQLWHLRNTGQGPGTPGEDLNVYPSAWQLTRGEGARIAIIDDAVDVLHEDLAPNVVSGASYSYRAGAIGNSYPLPCDSFDDHGTAVAGIAAARDGNALGVAGVAPRAQLVAYSALATATDADLTDALQRGLTLNGVYQNSWGSPDDGKLGTTSALITDAIEHGIRNGRDGKGVVYVFAGGNGGCYTLDRRGNCVQERSTLDGYLNQRGVIAACAVDERGQHPQYAEPGANLLVCGMSGDDLGRTAITTTLPKNDYRSDFSGTSASTPMVAGAAALVLAANPALTWRDVRLVLARSARRNAPTDPGWASAAAGLAFNPKFGFGVVDAGAAVALARSWSSVGGAAQMLSCGPYRRAPNLALPDPSPTGSTAPREDTVMVGAECAIRNIEYVEIRFSAAHPYSGDLRIELVSPNARISELAVARTCDDGGDPRADACGSYDDWQFGTVRHLEEAASGEWRLRVTDAQTGDTGTWQAWSLRIWGR